MKRFTLTLLFVILIYANESLALPTIVHSYISFASSKIPTIPADIQVYVGSADNPTLINDEGTICEGSYDEDCQKDPTNPCDLSQSEWILGWGTHFWDPYEGPGSNNSCDSDKSKLCNCYNFPINVDNLNAYEHASSLFEECKTDYHDGKIKSSYYKLGKIAHLLEDMGTPAHTHLDCHVGDYLLLNTFDDDSFEEYVESTLISYSVFQTKYPIKDLTPVDVLTLSDFGYPSEPLLFRLFYSMAQFASGFDSDDSNGSFENGIRIGRSIKIIKDIFDKADIKSVYKYYVLKPGDVIKEFDYDVSIARKKVILYQIPDFLNGETIRQYLNTISKDHNKKLHERSKKILLEIAEINR